MQPESTDFFAILECLARHNVEFIIVGGVSAVLQGAPVMTFDLDIVHSRAQENIPALLSALSELGAHYRHQTRHLVPRESHLLADGHQLLMTKAGPLDVLATIDEGRAYEDLLPFVTRIEVDGHVFQVLEMSHLIEVKERVGRPKDLVAVMVMRHTLFEEE